MFYTSELFAVSRNVGHGFFGCLGGDSVAPYESLNASFAVGDCLKAVAANRHRICEALGLGPGALVTLTQEHGTNVHVIRDPLGLLDASPLVGDGLVTTRNHLGLAILSADCAPVLWADPVNGVIGGCHAGWKGALAGILEETLRTLMQEGAQREHLHVVIGPTIPWQAYEVQEDFRHLFLRQNSELSTHFYPQGGRLFFDLSGWIQGALKRLGLSQIHVLPLNTWDGPFFSYRRTARCLPISSGEQGPRCGRNLSVIFLR
jgi:YfiH family protein